MAHFRERRRVRGTRQAILDAAEGSVIQFDAAIAGQTIVLASALAIEKPLTIEGPVPQGMTISGNLSTRVLQVLDDLSMRNISIINGRALEGGGAMDILNADVTLDHVLVANNEGRVAGGIDQVKADGQLVLVNSTFRETSGNSPAGLRRSGR